MLKRMLKVKSIIATMLIIAISISLVHYPSKIYAAENNTTVDYKAGDTICAYEDNDYRITFCIESSWDSGYNASVTITNISASAQHNWGLSFKTTDIISNIWNAKIKEKTSDGYIIRNDGWNQEIAAGEQVSFGYTSSNKFIAVPDIVPENRTISASSDQDYIITYILNNDWGSGFSSVITIKNTSGNTLEGWVLDFSFDREITDIWNATIEEHSGNHYKITNAGYNSNIVSGQTIEFGFNGVGGNISDEPCNLVISSYLSKNTDIIYDTDSDFIELPDGAIDKNYLINAILPSLVLIGDERTEIRLSDDYDLDGLTLDQEYDYDTNPFSSDTDEDGLTDYDEIFIYGTNPICRDTDCDGMSDGTEIECNLNPNSPDSDGNGISDDSEITIQTVRLNFSQNYTLEKLGVFPSISISGKGDYSGKISATPVLDNKAITGLGSIVGTAYDFRHDDSLTFEESTLSFKISDEILNNYNIDDLCIAYYDTETNSLSPIETSTSAYNIISAQVDHYCIYLVIDTLKYLNDSDYLSSGYIMESGRVDIVFVIDTTGSMSNMIREVRDNIESFADGLSENGVDARFGLVEYRDIEEDGYNSTKSHGWFDDVSSFKTELRKLSVDGGGDTPESAVDGLFCAANMKYRTGVHRHLILITDASSKVGTSNDSNKTLKDARDELYGRNVTVHAYVPKGYGLDYRDLFDTDSSHLAFVENGFDSVKESIVSEISEEANSGCWVRLSNGSVVFLEQDPDLGDETVDTDKDGIPDLYELSDKYYSEYNFRGYKVPVESWRFYSNPSDGDTDGDGISDGEDYFPNSYDAVIISIDYDAIVFNSKRVWNILPCTTSEYLTNVVQYKMPVTISYENYIKANNCYYYNKNLNGDYSLDELCLIALIDPNGIPLYADKIVGKVSSEDREYIIETILNRKMKYYRHDTDDKWIAIPEGENAESGFFKGTVLSEADLNLTLEPYRVIDINWVLDVTVRAAEIISLAFILTTSVAIVTENIAAFIGYVKLYGFSAGLKWYMCLGTSGFPDGAVSWLSEYHKSSDTSVKLYRAVSSGEYSSVYHNKKFVYFDQAMESKWFATTKEDAIKWGNIFYKDTSYKILEVTVKSEELQKVYYLEKLDNIGPAYCFTIEEINKALIRFRGIGK